MKFPQFLTLAIVSLFAMTSCWIESNPPEGLARYSSKLYRYDIDYPLDSSSAAIKDENGFHLLTILDNDKNYRIQVLALKVKDDGRFKFDYYPILDTMYCKNGNLQSETKRFFSDRIIRTYSIDEYLTMETTSIFGGECVYVIYSVFNEIGKSKAYEITESFRSSSGIGPVNFCRRKLYDMLGDNKFTVILSYLLFSLLGTLLFLVSIIKVFDSDSYVGIAVSLIVLVAVFSLIFVTDDFMGYFYGHNNISHYITALATLFGQGG